MHSPGSQALKAAEDMKDSVIFKKPTALPRRSKSNKSKILDEDTYIERMADIIQRDFFPHLKKLYAQNQYLDALEQNDMKRMRELYEKYSFGQPSTERPASPATFETPLLRTESEDNQIGPKVKQPAPSETSTNKNTENKIGLNAYLSIHTSEDNASFEEMMIEAEKKHCLKYAWLYEAEGKEESAIKDSKVPLCIESSSSNSKQLDSWGYRNKNFIMYIPDGVELTPEEMIEMAEKKQIILHENTRLKTNPFNEQQNKETINELAKTQSKANDGKIGVDGKEVVKNAIPSVNGFSLVTTPSPRPGECESPIMTWGQIEGTPFKLDGSDTPLLRTNQGPSFRMAEPPKREQIALQLAEKAGERHRHRKSKALEAARKSLATPSPRSTIDRLSTMSPAARRLATQKLKIASSPSPRRTSLIKTPSIGIKTPNMSRIGTPSKCGSTLSLETNNSIKQEHVLTDDLLKLPLQRQRASDFFNK